MSAIESRLVVVSNRLPVTISQDSQGIHFEPSTGGLITALQPLLKHREGVWIGWTGTDALPEVEELLQRHSTHNSFALRPVFMTPEERSQFYCGFSNEVLWPLFHDLQSRCNFDPCYWDAHIAINRRFAAKAATESRPGDLIWVHDYHLMSVATSLRQHGVTEHLAYFHHIPFPGPDIFEKLPWRAEILTALLNFDVVGFQTSRDQRNFLSCLRRFVKEAKIRTREDHVIVDEPGRTTAVGAFPISIDFDEFAQAASNPSVERRAAEISRHLTGTQLILGVDRLDYTKGLPERLSAFRHLLETKPELHKNISLVQVVVPSREDIPRYIELKEQIQRMISEINGRFGNTEWMPVHYIHRHLDRSELLAYYRAADVALITPLKDGMNLVAKEYCASRVDNTGVLILSEFAGAASQLQNEALLVNPYHTREVAAAIDRACRMPSSERTSRMLKLRAGIRRNDIFRWKDSFFSCLNSVRAHPSFVSVETSRGTSSPMEAIL